MVKRIYSITGFDCASCAEKCERHLNSHKAVSSARIDMVAERLYLEFEGEELTIEEILACIEEVEDDDIDVSPLGQEKKFRWLGKEEWFRLGRIAYCLIVFLVCGFGLRDFYWIRFGLYLSALALIAYDLAWKVVQNTIHRRNPIDEYLLITVASIGAFVLASLKYADTGNATAIGNDVFILEEHFEAILVCLLYQGGELLQDLAVKRSRKSIASAMDSRVEEAMLLTDDGIRKVEAKTLREGDMVLVGSGSAIPVDGTVIEGEGYCDTSSLTGESLPVALKEGSSVYSGTVLVSGEIKIRASADYASSSSARILELVSSSLERKGKADKFMTRFARVYTPVIFACAILYIVFAGIFGPSWRSAVYTGLEIMVISCPCALVISVPLAYFAAIGAGSRHGIVIKGATFLDALTHVSFLGTDKTGTLTKGRFRVTDVHVEEGVEESFFKDLLFRLEERSNHPLAKAIVDHVGTANALEVSDFETVLGKGVRAMVGGKVAFAGSETLLEEAGIAAKETSKSASRIYLGYDGKLLGYVDLEDEVKENTRAFLEKMKRCNVEVALLSGDSPLRVAMAAESLGIEECHGGLLPEGKLRILEEKSASLRGNTVFLGDGVNDAPCLARADIGVAMGSLGADLAIEEADVLLLRDDPMQFSRAMSLASRCRRTIVFNIAFALAVKVAVLVLAMIFREAMPMEVAVLADTGVSLLLTFHSLLLLYRG